MVKNGPQILESELSPPLQQSKICRHFVGKLEDQKRACVMCPKAGRRRKEGQGCTFKTLYAREQCGIPLCCGVKGLTLMNGTAKLCRNTKRHLFLYCMYPCYFYYSAVLLDVYTCQVSRLRRESHACRLKTSISRRLTPASQFLTPD